MLDLALIAWAHLILAGFGFAALAQQSGRVPLPLSPTRFEGVHVGRRRLASAAADLVRAQLP